MTKKRIVEKLEMNDFLTGPIDRVIQNFTNLRAYLGSDVTIVFEESEGAYRMEELVAIYDK